MSMNRVIHGAVRRDLARLDTALDEFREGDADRARDLARAYAFLRSELTRHHEHEDHLVWPMLERFDVDRTLLATMESEHHAMADALREVAEALDRLVLSPTVATARDARRVVEGAREVVDQHLAHEERAIEPVIHDLLDTPERKAVEKQLRKAPPGPVTFVLGPVLGRGYRREVAAVWHG